MCTRNDKKYLLVHTWPFRYSKELGLGDLRYPSSSSSSRSTLVSVDAAARNLATSTRSLSNSLPFPPLPSFLFGRVCCYFGFNFVAVAAPFAFCWTLVDASLPQFRHLMRKAQLPSHPHLQPQKGVCEPTKILSNFHFFQSIPTRPGGVTSTNT